MVLFADNTVRSISERVTGVCVDALYKSTYTLLYYMVHVMNNGERIYSIRSTKVCFKIACH